MRTLVKNTVFESASDTQLNLILDQQFGNLLTPRSEMVIQNALQARFGALSLTISIKKPTIQTLTQKEAQAHAQHTLALQKTFLNDKGVQALQKVFNAEIDAKSIREIT